MNAVTLKKKILIWMMAVCGLIDIGPSLGSPVYLIHKHPETLNQVSETGIRVGSIQHLTSTSPAIWMDGREITLPGSGEALAINGNLVVGHSMEQSFVYNLQTTKFTNLLQGISSTANAVNRNGIVAGTALLGNQTQGYYAQGYYIDLSSPNDEVYLKSMGKLPNGQSWANDISDEVPHWIAGASENEFGILHAYSYSLGNFTDIGEKWDQLFSTPEDRISEALAINRDRVVVGKAEVSPGVFHAFRFNPRQEPLITDLGTLNGIDSVARDINNKNQIVGDYGISDNERRGFIYHDGITTSLNTLITNPESFVVTKALSINDESQITGHGILNGVEHAIQLTPISWLPARRPSIAAAGSNQHLGPAVAMGEHTIASGNSHFITVLQFNGSIWERELIRVAPLHTIGPASLAVWENDIAVGSTNSAYAPKSAKLEIHRKSIEGWRTKSFDLPHSDRISISLDGNYLAAGLPRTALREEGLVYIYQKNLSGDWEYFDKISDTSYATSFGSAVALSDGKMAAASNRGAILVYSLPDLANPQTLIPNNPIYSSSLSMHGNVIATTSPTSGNSEAEILLRIFEFKNDHWIEHEFLQASVQFPHFFHNLTSVFSDTIVSLSTVNNAYYIYKKKGLQWISQKHILNAGESAQSITSYKNRFVIANPSPDFSAGSVTNARGELYIFDIIQSPTPLLTTDFDWRIDAPTHQGVLTDLTYKFIVTNSGESDAIAVKIHHDLPPRNQYSSLKLDSRCRFSANNAIECVIDTLPAGTSQTIPVQLKFTDTASFTLTAQLDSVQNLADDKTRMATVEITRAIPRLVIHQPQQGQVISTLNKTHLQVVFDLPGMTFGNGEHLEWCLNAGTSPTPCSCSDPGAECGDHANHGDIAIPVPAEGNYILTLRYLDADKQLVTGTVIPEGVHQTLAFRVAVPKVIFESPNEDLIQMPGGDYRVAYHLEGFELVGERYLEWTFNDVFMGRLADSTVLNRLAAIPIVPDHSKTKQTIQIILVDEFGNKRAHIHDIFIH